MSLEHVGKPDTTSDSRSPEKHPLFGRSQKRLSRKDHDVKYNADDTVAIVHINRQTRHISCQPGDLKHIYHTLQSN